MTAVRGGLAAPRWSRYLPGSLDRLRTRIDRLDARTSVRLIAAALAVVVYLRLVPAFPHLDAYGY